MKIRAIAILVGVVVAACGTEPVRVPPGTTTTTTSQVIALSDAQSAGVINSLNNGEILVAQAVMARLSQQDVFNFSQLMITEHTATNLQANTLYAQQGITPMASSLSQQIDAAAQQVVAQLQPLNDAALNSAYMNSQVAWHAQALQILDCIVGTSVQNATLASFVTGTVRPEDVNHLTQATSIAASLNGAQASVVGIGAATDCRQACVVVSAGGLFVDSIRVAACTAP
jgi:putative membrane protein